MANKNTIKYKPFAVSSPIPWTVDRFRREMGNYYSQVRYASPQGLRISAQRILRIEQFFKANPERWLQGDTAAFQDGMWSVDVVGAIRHARTLGLSLPRSNGRLIDFDLTDFANDNAPSLAHFLTFLRALARTLDMFADRDDRTSFAWEKCCSIQVAKLEHRQAQVAAYKARNKAKWGMPAQSKKLAAR